VNFQAVRICEPLDSGQSEIQFSACFEGLVVFVRHAGPFSESLLREVVTVTQLAQTRQQKLDCSARHSFERCDFGLFKTPHKR
jgi:hypothetical protein